MLRKMLLLLLMAALLWLSGCVTPVTGRGAAFGPCAERMDYHYCGP
jgi:hypothetical protein